MVTYKKSRLGIWENVFLLALVCWMASSWFRRILFENWVIAGVFLLNSIVITIHFINRKKISVRLLFLLYAILLFFQFKTTNIKNVYLFTPAEVDLQISRMNYYPPAQAKLGYILEHKKEVKVIEKYIENFIVVLDFNQYLPNYFSFLALPLFFIGLYWFVKSNLVRNSNGGLKVINGLLLFTIIILSLFGVNGKYGPFLFFPFIVLFIYIGIYGSFRNIR